MDASYLAHVTRKTALAPSVCPWALQHPKGQQGKVASDMKTGRIRGSLPASRSERAYLSTLAGFSELLFLLRMRS